MLDTPLDFSDFSPEISMFYWRLDGFAGSRGWLVNVKSKTYRAGNKWIHVQCASSQGILANPWMKTQGSVFLLLVLIFCRLRDLFSTCVKLLMLVEATCAYRTKFWMRTDFIYATTVLNAVLLNILLLF